MRLVGDGGEALAAFVFVEDWVDRAGGVVRGGVAPTVLLQLRGTFEHFNEAHPHSSLKMKSPREFRRQQIELQRCAQDEKSALNRV